MSKHSATCYLQVIPEFYSSGGVYAIKVVKMTQRIPADPEPFARIVEVKVTVDDAIFALLPVSLEIEADEAAAIVEAMP